MMQEKYNQEEIEILRNFNKRGSKYFYVIYKGKDFYSKRWIGKIYFSFKLFDWVVQFENDKSYKILNKEEVNFIFKILDQIKKDYP